MAEANAKWEAKFEKEVKGITADKVWPLFEDFCGIHKILPKVIPECSPVEGDYGKVGLVRYYICTAAALPPSIPYQPGVVYWSKEVMIKCDPVERCLSYQMIANNIGINGYVAIVKIDPVAGGDGCWIRWSVVCDPMDGRTFDQFKSDWSLFLEMKVENIVALLSPGTA